MNALHTFLRNKEQDVGFRCPACGSHGLDADDMDLANGWHHSEAMRARYHAACCKACADDHVMTEDGVCMPRGKAMQDAAGAYWADESALWDAEAEGDAERRDQQMCATWVR